MFPLGNFPPEDLPIRWKCARRGTRRGGDRPARTRQGVSPPAGPPAARQADGKTPFPSNPARHNIWTNGG